MAESQVLQESKTSLEVKDSDGKIRKKRFRMRTIGLKRKGRLEPVERQIRPGQAQPDQKDGDQEPEASGPHSQQTPLEKLLQEGKLVRTPYDLDQLTSLVEHSNILRECLDAMAVNIEGFGHLFRPRPLTDEQREEFKKELAEEMAGLTAFFDTICSDHSFPECRKRMRFDLESTGNGYFEIVRDRADRVAEVLHLPAQTIRLSKLDQNFTKYKVYQAVPSDGWAIKPIDRQKRFRRFVQVDELGKKVTWFKEWGDPRIIDKRTGDEADDSLEAKFRATELKHFRIYSPRSPYGIPRYIGRYVSIIGSRRSEEINFFTMGSNHVPSAFILVEDGELTEASVNRLTELVESGIAEDLNYSKFVLLEAETNEEEPIPGAGGKPRIAIEAMGKIQPKDQLFQEYDLNNQDKVRQAWRIPPIFVGRAQEYNRATAQASRSLADEQVFAPERDVVDHWVNQMIRSMDARFHVFKSRTPNITDNTELIRAMGIAEKSGGMTPRRADVLLTDVFDGQVGPQPKEIDLDVPYSLQFALAQNAAKLGGGGDGETVSREIDWVEEELEAILRLGTPDE